MRNGFGPIPGRMMNERDWEKARRPYYNLWPSSTPMLTRLDLDFDSKVVQLPLQPPCASASPKSAWAQNARHAALRQAI